MPDVADRQLLFGLLALQADLIDRDGLVAGFQAWTRDRSRDLADHLAASAGLDEDRRAAVETLVRLHLETRDGPATVADSDATVELPTPPATVAAGDGPRVGRIAVGPDGGGRFRILRPHANGSIGTVFVALDVELNREVALKRIREQYADDPVSRDRFLLEAEVTGGLEHPGIVPVHGLGTLDDGRPYYAMRLVRGGSFRQAVDAFHKEERPRSDRALLFRRLLRNFTDVCNAVDYAHSRGVLHRDLKPANVIVGDRGETFVVDWGLAKALGRSASAPEERPLAPTLVDGSTETLPGQALGTPAYMSPEQARGDLERVGPRADVYSLGATLYYLLTGKAPFQGPAPTVLNRVAAGDFPRPRAVDAAIDPALEAVVLKAMAVDPEKRYASARALADDVERWLADERVVAHREPLVRSLNRWLTRHRASVTGLAAAGLVAFVGLGIVSAVQTKARRDLDAKNGDLSRAVARLAASNQALDFQRERAEENEAQAIDAVKRFKDAVADNPELRDDPKLKPLRESLLKEPLTFFGKLRERLQAEGDARPEALYRLAGVALDHARLITEIGDKQDAIQAVRQALDILERLVRDHPDGDDFHVLLARGCQVLGGLLGEVGRLDESRAAQERGRDLFERLARDHPDVVGHQAMLANSHGWLGLAFRAEGRTEEALATFKSGIEILERLVRDHPDDVGFQVNLAVILGNRAAALADVGRFEQERESRERAVAICERLARDHPDVARYQALLAINRGDLAEALRRTGRTAEARKTLEQARDALERLVRDHPAVAEFQDDLASQLYSLADLSRAAGRADEASASFARSLETYRRLVRDHPEVPGYCSRVGWALDGAASVDLDASRFAEARDRLREAVGWVRKALDVDPVNAYYIQNLDKVLVDLGRAERGLGDRDEAARVERELADLRSRAARPDTVTTPPTGGK